jgi:hypothetical protein
MYHTLYRFKFNVHTTSFQVRKRLFCILDRHAKWTLSVYPETGDVIHFRLTKTEVDEHISAIKKLKLGNEKPVDNDRLNALKPVDNVNKFYRDNPAWSNHRK